MMRAVCGVLLAATLFAPAIGAQTVRVSVDCGSSRLGGAERAMCASPELTKLAADVDRLTRELEVRLSGRSREVIVDTEQPFARQFANCQNEPSSVSVCVERVLRHRAGALTAAGASTAPLVDELVQYSMLDVPYFQKYGELLIGKRISVWGCMTLAPGSNPASRIHGVIRESCSSMRGASVPAIFTRMDEKRAVGFYDAKTPSSHWQGVVERQGGTLVLARIDP